MIISDRVDWIFANSYIKRNYSISGNNPNLLDALTIFLYGVIKIAQLYFLQKKHYFSNQKIPNHLLVQSASPHMHLNYFRYFNKDKDNSKYIKIECFNKYQFTGIAKLSLLKIYREFYLAFREILPILEDAKKILNREDLTMEIMSSLPVFSYFTCLLRELKRSNSKLKLFSGGAPLISSAAILVNIETYYLAHGFINKPVQRDELNPKPDKYFLAYPEYNYIYTYSKEEKEYLELFEIRSLIKPYFFKKLTNFNRKIIIFLNYTDDNMHQEKLEDLIDIFYQGKYEVIIKIHPTYIGNFDKKLWYKDQIRFENSPHLSANDFIQQERPEFACGWVSTTLCEALNLGVIPICMSKEEDTLLGEVIYPLKKRSIMWDTERELINSYINNKTYGVDLIIKKLNSKNILSPTLF